ncbi:cytochrome c [Aurantimonas sp. HBX-1]|uniref:c-type cytochrome n=1 Tax=Aurantimonas sp. HBX-1 TaxID=2906072 RepID=UPI001F29A5D3|nr:cytochrome c [Aurantimonas sp. HBX-1]UIJ72144.1 cytochrome c [Aurantimonas sp. HBX-1]
MRIVLLALALAAGLGAARAQAPDAAADPVERGRILVVANCSGCHAVGLDGDSPNPQAPPFRSLSERFPIDALEETFIGTIDTGHPGMPVFKASQEQIDDVIAYIAAVME